MGHTNSTTNYGLPQFITTDKPAWLTDINSAFSAIDAAVDNAQDTADAAQNDATQALTDAGNAATAAAAADAKGSGAIASIEAAFDPTTVYSIGAKVMYNSLLYRCTVAVVTPGPWTGSANWERITVDSLIPVDASDLPLGSATPAGSTAQAIANLQAYVAGFRAGEQTSITPVAGSNYANYGNSWYIKRDKLIFLHIGVNGLTPNQQNHITRMPEGSRPIFTIVQLGAGGSSYTSKCIMKVQNDGYVFVYPDDAYAEVDLLYIASE